MSGEQDEGVACGVREEQQHNSKATPVWFMALPGEQDRGVSLGTLNHSLLYQHLSEWG